MPKFVYYSIHLSTIIEKRRRGQGHEMTVPKRLASGAGAPMSGVTMGGAIV
jgi:hypothetical protein